MPIKQITPDQAHEILDQDPEALYVDVRSIPEFTAAHPIRALNIPLLHRSDGGNMQPNPDFQSVSGAVLPKDRKLLVGCLRGGRSQKACMILEQMGYEQLYNVHGGFGGAIDPTTGEISQKGWQDLGLPTSRESGEGVSYESLKKKAES